MTELRRSSRVRQSAKLSGQQYYEPDEKKSILATPDVRPRKWRQAEVAVGYFKIRKWIPKDHQNLTAELHGGLTDPADVAAAAKHQLNFRIGKSSSRLKNRTRAAAAAAAAVPGGTPSRSQAITTASRVGGRTSPVGSFGAASPPWDASQSPPPGPSPPNIPTSSMSPGGMPYTGAMTVGSSSSSKPFSAQGVDKRRDLGDIRTLAGIGGAVPCDPPSHLMEK